MPRPTADPDAVLAALTPAQRQALDEAVEVLGLAGDAWHEAPAVAGLFELVAFAQLTAVLEGEGRTREEARDLAGLRLGVNDEAVERRIRRQRRGRTKCPRSSVPPGATVRSDAVRTPTPGEPS